MKIKLTESKLKQIVAESVKNVLKEIAEYSESNIVPDEYYDWEDEWSREGLDNAKIIQIPVNFLEEIFPGEYDSSRIVDGNKITYEYDRLGTPEERAKFFNYCKNNKYLSNVILNVKEYDDGVLDSIENEDEIVNYIKRYPNKKFVRYFMRELNSIKQDVAEFCRDYNNEQ
jgi:hypothetical protein